MDARTKVLLFVSPDNPSGAVYPSEQVAAIGRWAVERGIWVVTDEIYEHLTYGPHDFASMPTLVPDLADQCVIVNGVAKTYVMTGWRVGWMIAPPTSTRRRSTSRATPRRTWPTCPSARPWPRSAATSRRWHDAGGVRTPGHDDAREALGHPRGHVHRAAGRILLLPRSTGCSDGTRRARRTPASSLPITSCRAAKVAFVPGEAFGTPGYARFSFALGDDDLEEGIRRFAELAS